MANRVGIIGSLVWDVIYGRGVSGEPVEEWGGATYALSAFEAALDDNWEIVPLIKVGSDLIDRARAFLGRLSKLAPDARPIEVPEPNNRVVLHYQSADRRCERLTGGVPPWSWLGLKPLLSEIDALYINLISGFELDLETAQLIRAHFKGPIYCDLHSLMLTVQPDGMRIPRPLQNPEAWCRCFDFLQVNENEMKLMAHDPMALAAMAMGSGVSVLNVTLSKKGAVYFAASDFERLSDLDRESIHSSSMPLKTELMPAIQTRDLSGGDPTGCGDVWGGTYFSRLLAGDTITEAMRAAMVAAAKNVDHRGASGLARYLRGELSVK